MLPFDFDRRNKSDGAQRSSPTSRRARGSSTLAGRHVPNPPVAQAPGKETPPFAGGFPSPPRRYAAAVQTQEQRLGAADRSARGEIGASVHYYDEAAGRTGRSRVDARSVDSTPSPLRSETRTFTGKRRASGEMASLFSADADEFDDRLDLGRRSGGSDFAGLERANYHSVGYDSAAHGWAGSYSARRNADEHFSSRFSRQFDVEHHDDDVGDLYRRVEDEEKRQIDRRYRSEHGTGPSSAHYRISGLRISSASTTSVPSRHHSRNAPRTGSETHQNVMSEMGGARDRLMSEGTPVSSTGALAAASAASSSASSSPVIVREAGASASASALASISAMRPIANASRNIKFAMLQPHFERPLQEAAFKFGVCTTLLKKICRKNGIANWPFRKICGLRKSIASMEKQVQYFDGEQKKSYAEQLRKLQIELEAYKRIGTAPTPEFVQLMDEEEAAAEKEGTTSDNRGEDEGEGGDDDGAVGEDRPGSDAEDDDDDVLTSADTEEKQRRKTERVSPLHQPEPRRHDSPSAKHSASRNSSSSNRAVHYSRSDGAQGYPDTLPTGSGGRFDGHLHYDQVHSRPPTVVTRGYAPEHYAYHQQHHHQYQPEHRPQQHYYLDHHHQQQQQQQHFHPVQHQRARHHPQELSTIGVHHHALPSIGALLHHQGRDPAVPPDARDDRSRQYYEHRDGYQ